MLLIMLPFLLRLMIFLLLLPILLLLLRYLLLFRNISSPRQIFFFQDLMGRIGDFLPKLNNPIPSYSSRDKS